MSTEVPQQVFHDFKQYEENVFGWSYINISTCDYQEQRLFIPGDSLCRTIILLRLWIPRLQIFTEGIRIRDKTFFIQESPPAWTQEAYRPPRSCSKCLLFQGGYYGYPPYLDLGWGTPPAGPGMGYPPTQTWDGVPPYLDLGWGTPYLDLRWGTPLLRPEMGYPPTQTWDVVPPPPRKCGQTENIIFPSFGWRAVIIQ